MRYLILLVITRQKDTCETRRRIMDRSIMRQWEHAVFVSNIVSVVGYVQKDKTITYKTLLNTHRLIFETVYPWAGSDRSNFNITIGKSGYQTLFAHPLVI